MGPESKRRPWWAAALAGGFGAVLATAIALGLIHRNEADAQPVRTTAVVGQEDRDARLSRIEQRLNEIERAVGRIEGRLDRK